MSTTNASKKLIFVEGAETLSGSGGADSWLVNSEDSGCPLRDPVILREQVILQLRCIIDPDLNQDIVSLGFIKNLKIDWNEKLVSFTLELTTPACPVKEQFVNEATRLLKNLGWIDKVEIELTAKKPAYIQHAFPLLDQVKYIILIASCKGGVGKSTIACNLAFMIKKLGAKVGLVDADVYGPSLPSLIPLEDQYIKVASQKEKSFKKTVAYEEANSPGLQGRLKDTDELSFDGFVPLVYESVKVISYGYFKASKKYAAIRGPIASTLVTQMIGNTVWGDLDYLIVDLPPGTGDIHVSVAQNFQVSGAVMITTPQKLSLVDVEKGVAMFDELKIPTIALIENMAEFVCSNCHATYPLFKYPNLSQTLACIKTQYGIDLQHSIPFHPDLTQCTFQNSSDLYFPFAEVFSESHVVYGALKKFCEALVRKISFIQFDTTPHPILRVLDNGMLELVIKDKMKDQIFLTQARNIRLHCRCAECVNEFTGVSKINTRKIASSVAPVNIQNTGNYAFSILWSDKHLSILSFQTLIRLFQQEAYPEGTFCIESEENEW